MIGKKKENDATKQAPGLTEEAHGTGPLSELLGKGKETHYKAGNGQFKKT